MAQDGIIVGEDGVARCWWGSKDADYIRYHDLEWGFIATGDVRLYEKICLEGFQSGLSWITILRKREAFRAAFANFDFREVAKFDESDVERLLQDASIVRHRKKIESTINNARQMEALLDEFGTMASYVWGFEPEYEERPRPMTRENMISKCPSSIALAKDLKKRGWSFVGPTTVYSFMQSVGIVNDHLEGCHARELATQARVELLQSSR